MEIKMSNECQCIECIVLVAVIFLFLFYFMKKLADITHFSKSLLFSKIENVTVIVVKKKEKVLGNNQKIKKNIKN